MIINLIIKSEKKIESFSKITIQFWKTKNFVDKYLKWENHFEITNSNSLNFTMIVGQIRFTVNVNAKNITITNTVDKQEHSYNIQEIITKILDKNDVVVNQLLSYLFVDDDMLNKKSFYNYPITDISTMWMQKQIVYLLSFYITYLIIKEDIFKIKEEIKKQKNITIKEIIEIVNNKLKKEILEKSKKEILEKSKNINNWEINDIFNIRYLKEVKFLNNCKEEKNEVDKENLKNNIEDLIKSNFLKYLSILYKEGKEYKRVFIFTKDYNIISFKDNKLKQTKKFQENKENIKFDLNKFLNTLKNNIEVKDFKIIKQDILNIIKNENNILLEIKNLLKEKQLNNFTNSIFIENLFKSIYIEMDVLEQLKKKIKDIKEFLLTIKVVNTENIEYKYFNFKNNKIFSCINSCNFITKNSSSIQSYIKETLWIQRLKDNIINLIINWWLENIINKKELVKFKKINFNIFNIKDEKVIFYKKSWNIIYQIYFKTIYHKDFFQELFVNEYITDVLSKIELENIWDLIKPMYNKSNIKKEEIKEIAKEYVSRDIINKILNS